jgi:purine-binding chemotaxis protein CheW
VKEGEELVLFRAGGAGYALEIRAVREIKKVSGYTAVRHAPASVIGVINLRGRIVTLLDTGRILGDGAWAPAFPLTVLFVADGEEWVGLAVDEVLDTVAVQAGDVLPLPANIPAARRKYLRGIYRRGDGTAALLDGAAVSMPENP